ncbi:MAG TPA: hypothetical protein VLT59_08085 [Steroidobacteraceae bacterium]|nr:hypothetical protein [Steroidobacteraceae bacterium]
MSARGAGLPGRPVAVESVDPDDVEELRVRLDDVPIPDIPLDVDGLRPTLGSLVFGLLDRLRPAR